MKHLAAAVVVLALAPVALAADLVTNGNFESDTVSGGVAETRSSLTGWTLTNYVDLIGTYWQASPDGGNNLHLSYDGTALSGGSISQTLATTNGVDYVLKFYMAGNPDGGPPTKAMTVTIGSTPTVVTFDTTFVSTAAMGWTLYTLNFSATSSSTTLTFANSNNTGFGPALDGVSVTAVPEPATLALFGLGIAGLGLWRRSSKKRAPARA